MAARWYRRQSEAALGVITTDVGGIYVGGVDPDIEDILPPYLVAL